MRNIILMLLLCLVMMGCASTGNNSTNDTDSKPGEMINEINYTIDTISIDFKYENIVTETKESSEGSIENTIKNFGQGSFNLLLLDSIYHNLKYKDNLNIEKNRIAADCYIIVHPAAVMGVGSINCYVDIEILSDTKMIISRKIIFENVNNDYYFNKLVNECTKYITRIIKY